MSRLVRPLPLLGVLTVVYLAFALLRGLDHDESQYVAAAGLTADGLLPYRDFAYLQTPLQPLAFAPIAWVAGALAWPALRIVNALLGVLVVAASWRAMRVADVRQTTATLCAALLAACDILLFSSGTARNDALPAALFALTLAPMIRADRGNGSRPAAVAVGLVLALAAAAKISYAIPAVAYGAYALFVRRHRPGWLLLGGAPVVAATLALAATAPLAFLFGTISFPGAAPAQYYTDAGRAWKLGGAVKLLDTLKFLALGPALLAIAALARRRGSRRIGLLDILILAGLVAALLPSPTWRQYLLPLLPPLFVRLAMLWDERPPGRRMQIACAVFAVAGLAPTVAAILTPSGLAGALNESRAARTALDANGVTGPVATLAPQFVPMTGRALDPRFATGPFYFRSRGLLSMPEEYRLRLIARETLVSHFWREPPTALLLGGEGGWTSGDDTLDQALEEWARQRGWRRVPVTATHLRLYLPPQATARSAARPSIASR